MAHHRDAPHDCQIRELLSTVRVCGSEARFTESVRRIHPVTLKLGSHEQSGVGARQPPFRGPLCSLAGWRKSVTGPKVACPRLSSYSSKTIFSTSKTIFSTSPDHRSGNCSVGQRRLSAKRGTVNGPRMCSKGSDPLLVHTEAARPAAARTRGTIPEIEKLSFRIKRKK